MYGWFCKSFGLLCLDVIEITLRFSSQVCGYMCMQTSVLWKLNYIFIVVFVSLCVIIIERTIDHVCLLVSLLKEKYDNCHTQPFPWLVQLVPLWGMRRRGKGRRIILPEFMLPVHWGNFYAEPIEQSLCWVPESLWGGTQELFTVLWERVSGTEQVTAQPVPYLKSAT